MELAFASAHHSVTPLKLTARERDVFALLEFDLESDAAVIAKNLRTPAATVNYTLRKLVDRGIIRPRCFINSFKLGLHDVGFFFSLSEQSQASRQKLIRRFKEDPAVAYFGSVLGDYQYVAVILCRGLSEFSAIVARLTGDQGEIVSDKSIIPRLSVKRFARKYINPRLASKAILAHESDGPRYEFDQTDEKLIMTLGNNPYQSLRALAREAGLPLATVDRRVKQLRASGVIQGFFYDLNVAKLGIQSFRLLVRVHGLSCAVHQKVIELCRKHPLVVYLIEVLGSWDFEIGIETSDPRNISSFIGEL